MKRLFAKITVFTSHPLARGSMVVLVGTTISNVGSYAYHLVVGRMLGPIGYGELASLLSLLYILNVPSLVMQTVLTKYVATFRAKNELGRAKTLSLYMIKAVSIGTAVFALILIPFIGVIAGFLHINHPWAVFYTYLTAVFWLASIVQISLLQGLQRFMAAMVLANVSAVLRLLGGAMGGFFGVVETVLAGVISSALGFLAYFVPLRSLYRLKPERIAIPKKEFIAYSVPSLLTMLGVTSLYVTDIMLAKHFLSPVEAGYYAAVSVLGKIIYFASSSISYVLFPVVAERSASKSDSHRLVHMGILAVLAVSGGITLFYFLLPKTVLLLLFGQSYFPASPYVGTFGIFLSLYSVSYLLATTLLGIGRTQVWIFLITAALVQIGGIWAFHGSIFEIINVNIAATAVLTVCLLLYYRHAVQEH